MSAPTLSEIVPKLGESVSTLFALVEHAKQDLSRVEAVQEKTTDRVQEMMTKFAVIEERLNELKKVTEESGRRRFSVWQGLLCAVLGSVLALAGQIGLTYLKAHLGVGP